MTSRRKSAPVPRLGDHATVAEARAYVAAHADKDGVVCPCCGRPAKARRRPINAPMGVVLVLLERHVREVGEEFVHVERMLSDSLEFDPEVRAALRGDFAKLAHWGLIERKRQRQRGWWRITHQGREFVAGRLRVVGAKYFFNKRLVQKQDVMEQTVSIEEVLGPKYDLQALLDAGPSR